MARMVAGEWAEPVQVVTVGAQHTVFTVGHSNHTVTTLVHLLRAHRIATVVDVRSRPYSRYCPQFCKDAIASSLRSENFRYLFAGGTLGGLLEDPRYLGDDGKPDYSLRARAPDFRDGISKVVALASDKPPALMCAEEDPTHCHRRRLITPPLQRHGVEVFHIRSTGIAQPESEWQPRQIRLL